MSENVSLTAVTSILGNGLLIDSFIDIEITRKQREIFPSLIPGRSCNNCLFLEELCCSSLFPDTEGYCKKWGMRITSDDTRACETWEPKEEINNVRKQ